MEDALAHLTRADAVLDALPADAEGFAVWYERGEVHYRRARVLTEAERFEEALAEAEKAIAVHEGAGSTASWRGPRRCGSPPWSRERPRPDR